VNEKVTRLEGLNELARMEVFKWVELRWHGESEIGEYICGDQGSNIQANIRI
jgi:hypothetical protein